MCRVTARVSTSAMPTIPCARSSSSSSRRERQLDARLAPSRTTKPATQIREDSGSSSLTPVLPMCGAVMTTIWRWYDGSVRVSWYPVMPVEKTISPRVRPREPHARPRKTVPSSSTSRAVLLDVIGPPWRSGRRQRPSAHRRRWCSAPDPEVPCRDTGSWSTSSTVRRDRPSYEPRRQPG